ncbi:dCTP deaminase [Caldiplasma sukawensis]
MISDGNIKRLSEEAGLIKEFKEENLTPNGYDLTIGSIYGERGIVDEIDVLTGSWVKILTAEKLLIPEFLTGLIQIKSRFARKGLIGSFGYVDAGFSGVLELFFYSSHEGIHLKKGDRIVQIIFIRTEKPEKNYAERSGNFNNINSFTDLK